MNLGECKTFIKDFLNDNSGKTDKKEQLNWLKGYNFSKLGYKEGVHEDSTKLAKAIYFIVWHDKLPRLTSWENMEEYYGGETINTFNTLFQSEFLGIKEYIPLTEENAKFYIEVINFRINYVTIGDFMLLPKISINDTSLNKAKGNCYGKYKDYADLFFVDLFKENNQEQYLKDLKDENSFYFKEIGAKEFCEINFLKDYFEADKPKIIFKENHEFYPYYWWQFENKSAHSDDYKKFAIGYIKKVNDIIKYRADEICKILETELW